MKLLVLLIWTIPVLSFGQVIAVDFEDNDLTGWYENIPSRWQISPDNPIDGSFSLTHAFDNPDAGTDWIAIFHNPIDFNKDITTWEFSLKYDHNPSSSNNWSVFLSVSDLPSAIENIEDALIIGVNYRGSNDEIALWKQNGQEIVCLYSTGFNWEENINPGQIVKFRIERSQEGNMQISIDTANNGYNLIGKTDSVEMSFSYSFLLYYKYTSTYDRGLTFDNLKIKGSLTDDVMPPEVNKIRVLSPQKFEIDFNEIVKIIGKNEFCIDEIGCGQADHIIGQCFQIDSPYPLKAGNYYTCKVPELSDISGNHITSNNQEKNFYYAKAFDIVINEIMADPDPTVLLPEVEYIELYNRTNADISLKDWHLTVNNKKILLPEYILESMQYVVLCDADSVNQFEIDRNKIVGIVSFPAINNENCDIVVSDVSDQMIHAINFSKDWYLSPDKKEGGWSLEMIDPNDPCVEFGNWKESVDFAGGTPGKVNSVIHVNSNQQEPELYRAAIKDSNHVVLYFSEPLDSNSTVNPSFFNVDKGVGSPDSIFPSIPLANKVTLFFNNEFQPGVNYEISLTSDITDCSGNIFSDPQSAKFIIPEIANWGDVVINEIMYNPAESEEEYIELFNNSDKTIELKDWLLSIGDSAKNLIKITDENFPISSGSYLIISQKYPENMPLNEIVFRKNILLMPEMPSLSNEGSNISLFDSLFHLIEKITYSPENHHEIVENSKGVSLERISANVPGADINNWQSASSDAGYKTPAAKNSQYSEFNEPNEIILNPGTITPNNDGIDDILEITYTLDKPGYMGRILVFDIAGNQQYEILKGGLLGSEGSFLFDGKDIRGNKLTTGYYIIFFEAYSEKYKGFKTKKTFVIANTE